MLSHRFFNLPEIYNLGSKLYVQGLSMGRVVLGVHGQGHTGHICGGLSNLRMHEIAIEQHFERSLRKIRYHFGVLYMRTYHITSHQETLADLHAGCLMIPNQQLVARPGRVAFKLLLPHCIAHNERHPGSSTAQRS